MAEALKEMFNEKFYEKLGNDFCKASPGFKIEKFLKELLLNNDQRSLNERMRNTSQVLQKHLPASFEKCIELMVQVIPNYKGTYTACLFPDFVGLYGLDNFDLSMQALSHFTQYGSSEFAIRNFLLQDFDRTIKVMNQWAENDNLHVRRLASEGSRSRLPWSFKLERVINQPQITESIIEKLKTDPELYVKKSVANHLNDISKDNPEWMLKKLKHWDLKNEHSKWIMKHACRTLIKKGNKSSLSLFGFEDKALVRVENLIVAKKEINIGESQQFEFEIVSQKNKTQKLVVDFSVDYRKKNGKSATKVFKLKEFVLNPKQTAKVLKSHRFQNFSTRKHYPGIHTISILINGKLMNVVSFELVEV